MGACLIAPHKTGVSDYVDKNRGGDTPLRPSFVRVVFRGLVVDSDHHRPINLLQATTAYEAIHCSKELPIGKCSRPKMATLSNHALIGPALHRGYLGLVLYALAGRTIPSRADGGRSIRRLAMAFDHLGARATPKPVEPGIRDRAAAWRRYFRALRKPALARSSR